MNRASAEEAILASERRRLDRWSQGDPGGFAESSTSDVTYFDDIGAQGRIDGIDAAREYMAALGGQIPPHTYEIVEPKVQVYGDVGILTLRYHPKTLDGEPGTRWKATSVYRRIDGEWLMAHAHWSMNKDA